VRVEVVGERSDDPTRASFEVVLQLRSASDPSLVVDAGSLHDCADPVTARLGAARAVAAEAALNLDWTVVRAPVDGAVGRADVTVGNLVTGGPGDGTLAA